MMTLTEIIQAIGRLPHDDTPEAIADALALLALIPPFLPESSGRLAAAGLAIARDAALAGKGPESIDELRATIRGSWQGAIDLRFPNG